MRIAILGSSPVSLIYAILLSQHGIKSTIFAGDTIGGAWSSYKYLKSYNLPNATHILMHSDGLYHILNKIQYRPLNWGLAPSLVDENLKKIRPFGISPKGIFIGAPILDDCLITFLIKSVESSNLIDLKYHSKIERLSFLQNNDTSASLFQGALITSGTKLKLEIDNGIIKRNEKTHLVFTINLFVKNNFPFKSTFIHFSQKESYIREIEIISVDKNFSNILCKLSKKGKNLNNNLIIEEIHKAIYRLYSEDIEIINFKIYKYNNIRHQYLVNEDLYNDLPLIIPGIYRKNNFNLGSFYKTSQDLAQVFYSPELIENEIRNKFVLKKTKYFLESNF